MPKFHPNSPLAYFITFRTYGTWLHGDERGSVDQAGHNIPGTPVISPNTILKKINSERLKYPHVTLTSSQRKSIDSTIKSVGVHNDWKVHSLNVRTQHVHLVINALKTPEAVMNSLKSWCTRRMSEHGIWGNDYSPWSHHGSTRYVWNQVDLQKVCNYVLYCQD